MEFVKREAFLANNRTTSTQSIKSAGQNKTQGKHTITHTTYANNFESPQRPFTPSSPNTTRQQPLTLLCHHCQSFAKQNTADCKLVASLNSYELKGLIGKSVLSVSEEDTTPNPVPPRIHVNLAEGLMPCMISTHLHNLNNSSPFSPRNTFQFFWGGCNNGR